MVYQSPTDAAVPKQTGRSSEMSKAVATIEQSLAAISLKHEIEGLSILLGLFQELDQTCKCTGHSEVLETKGREDAWNALHAAYVKRIIAVLRSIELNHHAHELVATSDFFKKHLTYDNGSRGSHMDIASFLVQPSDISDREWRTKACDFIEKLSVAISKLCDGIHQAAKDRSGGIKGTIAKAVEDAEQQRLNPARQYWSMLMA